MKQCKPFIINNPSRELLILINKLRDIQIESINSLRNKSNFYFNHDYRSK